MKKEIKLKEWLPTHVGICSFVALMTLLGVVFFSLKFFLLSTIFLLIGLISGIIGLNITEKIISRKDSIS